MPTHINAFTLSLVQGHAEPSSAFLAVFDGGRTFVDTTFYAIVDLAGRPDDAGAAKVQSVLQKSIGGASKVSLTGAMERAVIDAHREAWKRGPEAQNSAVLCVALRANELYVSCRGRMTVMTLKNGGIHRPEFAMGVDEAWMERVDLVPGETLVLGNTTLAESISKEAEVPILDAEPDEAARRVYYLAKDYPQVSALFFRARHVWDPAEQ